MKARTKKILIIILPLFFLLAALILTFLYNRGFLGYKEYGYCLKEGTHNNWFAQNRGFGRAGHHSTECFNKGCCFDYSMLIPIFFFIGIVGAYLIIRYKSAKNQSFKTKKKCGNCKSDIEKDWKTCPFCGHKL